MVQSGQFDFPELTDDSDVNANIHFFNSWGEAEMSIDSIKEWFLGFGEKYGVNPVIFGIIYFGAIPFFSFSVAWLVRNARSGRSVIIPIISTGFF